MSVFLVASDHMKWANTSAGKTCTVLYSLYMHSTAYYPVSVEYTWHVLCQKYSLERSQCIFCIWYEKNFVY